MSKLHHQTLESDLFPIPERDGGSPGKRSMTQGLAPRPIVFRVESAEAARELGAAFGPRDRQGVAEDAEAAVDRAAAASGQPLRADVRERFESSLGADLSAVRVHTGGEAAEAAEAVGARAYTVGNDIHFGAGEYQPDDPFGLHLLAHEVAHTQQQAGGMAHRQNKLAVSSAGDAAEVEADRAADAMVSGASYALAGGGTGGIQRKGKELSADDKNRLDNAKQLIDKAEANASKAIKSLSAYGQTGATCLEAIKAGYDAYIDVYEGQFTLVNARIASAKATLKLQQSVMIGALNAVFGGVASGIISAELGIAQSVENVQAAYGALAEWMAPIGGAMASGTAHTAGVKSGGQATLAAGGGDTVSKKLAFWTNFAKLQGSSTRLVGLAANAADINKAIGEVKQAIAGSKDSGQARSDYAPTKVEDDAARLESGTRQLGGAAPSIDAALGKMKAAETQMKALKPDEKTIEKEIWIQWAGSLPASETGVNGILDADGIEDHLKSIGVWKQLGIEIGGYFEDDEEAMAVASANAISKVLAHKGTTVNVECWGGQPMGKVKIGNLPAVPVSISNVPPHPDAQNPNGDLRRTVKAQVMSASAKGTLDPKILDQTDRTKSGVADHLLSNGHIIVQLEALEASAPAPEPAIWGKDPEPDTRSGPPSIHGSYGG